MTTVLTSQGDRIEVISERALRDPRSVGPYVRAFCHIHGSDHQRSLSIHRASGWGHCFNANCLATVLVAEWNPVAAARLEYHGVMSQFSSLRQRLPVSPPQAPPLARQLVLLSPPRETTLWQRDELAQLQYLEHGLHRAFTHSPRARAYLHTRGISLGVAMRSGLGYLSPDLFHRLDRQARQHVERWEDRVVFPLMSPVGRGFIGRSLWGWRPGMDENRHKALLNQERGPKRWTKTNPAGWFCVEFDRLAERVIFVEGGFDRLALLDAGFAPEAVIALVGTSAAVEWLPGQVKSIVLALDGDSGGREATERLAEQLHRSGLLVSTCTLPQDRYGKDWNERWRLRGATGLEPLLEAYYSSHYSRSA